MVKPGVNKSGWLSLTKGSVLALVPLKKSIGRKSTLRYFSIFSNYALISCPVFLPPHRSFLCSPPCLIVLIDPIEALSLLLSFLSWRFRNLAFTSRLHPVPIRRLRVAPAVVSVAFTVSTAASFTNTVRIVPLSLLSLFLFYAFLFH